MPRSALYQYYQTHHKPPIRDDQRAGFRWLRVNGDGACDEEHEPLELINRPEFEFDGMFVILAYEAEDYPTSPSWEQVQSDFAEFTWGLGRITGAILYDSNLESTHTIVKSKALERVAKLLAANVQDFAKIEASTSANETGRSFSEFLVFFGLLEPETDARWRPWMFLPTLAWTLAHPILVIVGIVACIWFFVTR